MLFLVFNIFLVSFIIMSILVEIAPEYIEDEFGILIRAQKP